MKKTAYLLLFVMVFSLLVIPATAADVIVYTTADENYTETGSWSTTTKAELQGPEGSISRYASKEAEASWVPHFAQGTYKVSVYKVVHQNSLNNQVFEIVHRGKTDYAVVDFTTGQNGWVELGTYDFWGDGDDWISVTRAAGVKEDYATRMLAVSFELIAPINEPIPEVKPEVQPGEKPEFEQETAKIPEIKEPEKVGDVMLIPASNPLYCKHDGAWSVSNAAVGYDGSGSYYASKKDNSFTYLPYMPAGKYKVEIFKSVHEWSLNDQTYTINHADKTDTVVVDFTSGDSEWVTLGEYDFWGNGNDTVSAIKKDSDAMRSIRNSAIRFTLLELSDKPVPEGKPRPVDPNADVEMTIPAKPIVRTDEISVVTDGVLLKFDQPATLVDDRTLVPLRGIFEALGAYVYWADETQTVTGIKGDTTVVLRIGDQNASVNGKNVTLDVPPQLINSRTMVPVRFISESLGAAVNWEDETQTVYINTQKEDGFNQFVSVRNLDEFGSWQVESQVGGNAFAGANLIGLTDETGVYEPAKVTIKIPKTGDYQLFVHARDYATNQQGSRFFEVELNGMRAPKALGRHGQTGFFWERIGPLHLQQGELEIALHDTSTFYARCDGIFITDDVKMKNPPEEYAKIREIATIFGSDMNQDTIYPLWAETDEAPEAVTTIKSDKMQMDFHTVNTSGGTVIQRTFTLNGKTVSDRENPLAALLFYASNASLAGTTGQFPLYQITHPKNGVDTQINTGNLYKLGTPSWLIPSEIEKLDENKVLLKASNGYADATFTVELKNGETEPIVDFTFNPKQAGFYTASLMTNPEHKEFSYAFAPFRYNGTVIPDESLIISEPYCTIPMALKTVKNEKGETVSLGIAVEPESVPLRWPKDKNAEYGMALTGVKGNAQPSLAAPLFTSENAKMEAGDSYSIRFRLIEQPGEWYPIYEHLALDVYNLTDYRKNFKSTLTDAIFNTTSLAGDDYAGWDTNQKGYYNIEAENLVTQSNPLVFMSTYLLTEDKDFLERRTIPTLAYLLTRPGFHYNNGDIEGEAVYGGVGAIGDPCRNYGSAVFGGGYKMSQGLMPQLSALGIDNGVKNIDSYGSAPLYQEYTWLYRYTGNKEYLERAKTEADKFIEKQIDAPRGIATDEEMFIAIKFYPQFFGLIDLYEVTNEQKYIDAAVRAAKNLLPTVWIYPNSGEELYTVSADYTKNNHYGYDHLSWNGKKRFRAGYPEGLEALQDETVPFWAVSRAGLSLEQTFTYTMHDSGNMIMACWAPDLMRLAEYSGEKIFETYARNAVIGRHSTYTGYYYNNYFAYQQNPEYAYNGPDITGLYWHHMQPFLAMLQDFLFTQAWNWSDKQIDFPSVRNMGYAYFSNRMYGGGSGTFFDEKDMWLWLKEGVMQTDNVQLDWIGARKDGVAGFAFMNEDTATHTATFTLGDVLAGFSGVATVYDASGNKTELQITDGKGEITVPGRSLVAITIKSDAVSKPGYADVKVNEKQAGKQTAMPKDGETDGGHILQMSDDEYFAYVYITEMLDEADKAVLHYKKDGKWETTEDTYAPFEFIVRVDDPKTDFTYYVEKVINGKTVKSSEKTLTPLTK